MYNAIGQLENGQLISVKVAVEKVGDKALVPVRLDATGRTYLRESASAHGTTYSDGVTRIYIPRSHQASARPWAGTALQEKRA